MSTSLSEFDTKINDLKNGDESSSIVEDYYLESYKKVYDQCAESNHVIDGQAILNECLRHNYSWLIYRITKNS